MKNNDKIKVLNPKQQAQEKLPIFYGSRDNFMHGFKEVLANAIDEVFNNFEEGEITVKLYDDNKTISVKDTGRGIPIHKRDNRDLLFQTLFAGTKLDVNDKTTTGTNGCGTCVLCYTSETFIVKSTYGGKTHMVKYFNGDEVGYEEKSCNKEYHETEVIFKLMDSMYTKTEYNYEEVLDVIKRSVVTTNTITINFTYKDKEHNFKYDSTKKYLEEHFKNTTNIFDGISKQYNNDDEFNQIQVVLGVCSEEPTHESYLNMNYLPEGGTLNDGLINGIKLFMNKYISNNKLYEKNEKPINNNDVAQSISFVINHLSNKVEYQNQTKYSTNKKLYKDIAQNYIQEQLEIFVLEQPMDVKALANQILINKRANEKVTDYIAKAKKQLTQKINNIDNRVDGFVDCKKHGAESMLFIAEGLSALGSIVLARDGETQACFPLKGKMLNLLKTDLTKILNNKEVKNLIKVLGCGIENKKTPLDKSLLRFEKIVIATDQDTDGLHIQCLVLVCLYKLCPTLIKDGHIYILDTPLYEIRDIKTDEMHYAFNDEEMEMITKTLNKYQISRNKGLGEVDVDTMSMCIQKNSKSMRKVEWEDAEKIAKTMETFMGSDLQTRKKYIQENLHRYTNILD